MRNWVGEMNVGLYASYYTMKINFSRICVSISQVPSQEALQEPAQCPFWWLLPPLPHSPRPLGLGIPRAVGRRATATRPVGATGLAGWTDPAVELGLEAEEKLTEAGQTRWEGSSSLSRCPGDGGGAGGSWGTAGTGAPRGPGVTWGRARPCRVWRGREPETSLAPPPSAVAKRGQGAGPSGTAAADARCSVCRQCN